MQKVILHFRVCLISIILLPLLIPFHQFTLFPQTEDCTGKLVRAEQEYQAGNFSEAVDLIKPCLKSDELSEAEKGKAYRLLGLVYIAEELEKDANEAVKNLLIMVPKYKVDMEKDPPQLKKIIDTVSRNLIPEISGITPDNAFSGEQKVILKVSGKNFAYGSTVRFNNIDKKTNYISTNTLEAELTSDDLGRAGENYVNVHSPILDGKSSNTVIFNIGSQNLKFSINGLLPVPMGDLAADKGNDGDGFASIGYGGIVELNYPLNTTGLGWISSVGYFYNGESSSLAEIDLMDSGLDYTSEKGSYSVIPVMSGISYTGIFSPKLGYIISGQIMYAHISVGDESYQYSGFIESLHVAVTDKYKYESVSSFGFGLGGGLIINNLIIISVKYLSLGNPDLKYDETLTLQDLDTGEIASATFNDSRKQSFSYFTLSIGLVF